MDAISETESMAPQAELAGDRRDHVGLDRDRADLSFLEGTQAAGLVRLARLAAMERGFTAISGIRGAA